MRQWAITVLLTLAAGCASVSERGEGQAWCAHERYWGPPHSLDLPEPDDLDLDLVGGLDPRDLRLVEAYAAALHSGSRRNRGLVVYVAEKLPDCQAAYYAREEGPWWNFQAWVGHQRAIDAAYLALLEHYEAEFLQDLARGAPALWIRLGDVFRIAKRNAPEVAWRTLGRSALKGGKLKLAWREAEQAREEFDEVLWRLRSGVVGEEDLKHFLRDDGFKELLAGVRRAWRLAGRESGAVVLALKSWRRREQTLPQPKKESLAEVSRGAERYRDRALDAALDATLAAEGTRQERHVR